MDTKKILVIEDDNSVRLLLKLFLIRYDAKLLEAKNGLEGIGVARQFQPDLIITDVSMPVMDGIEFVKEVRADAVLKATPIIVFTGTGGVYQNQASAAGATAVLEKPIKKRDLINVIEAVLGPKK